MSTTAARNEAASERSYLRLGTPRFWRASAALFVAGFATFASLYDVQPLLPALSRAFGASPGVASLALSTSTFALAFSIVIAGSFSERWGRKVPIVVSLVASAALTLVSAAMPTFGALLAVRALEGVALSGLPAIAMAYVGEEVEPAALGFAMGLYIGGTALGGMSGRFLSGVVLDLAGWRAALVAVGVLGFACAIGVRALLPLSRNFTPRPLSYRETRSAMARHLRDPGLPWLYAIAFAIMGAFVTSYNYLSYTLEAPPYTLRQTAIAAIFGVYLVGVAASAIMGRASDRLGTSRALVLSLGIMFAGAALMLATPLFALVGGLALLTFGFFGAHSIASAWVGSRARAARGHASALYLWSYYMGSSAIGSLGGFVYGADGWKATVALVLAAIAAASAIALGPLRRLREAA